MTEEYDPDIVTALQNFFDEDDWKRKFIEEKGMFQLEVMIPGKIRTLQYVVKIHEHDYVVYAMSPFSADPQVPEQMAEMEEFVCRANYGLRVGNFELDVDTGDIRYKCHVNCDGVIPNFEMIKESVYYPLEMFKQYGDGIVKVLFNGGSARQEIAACEDM